MIRGVLFDVKRFALHDGPGIRVTFFLTGCPLDCWWCHNPEGLRATPAECDGPAAPGAPWVERRLTPAEVVAEAEADRVFMEESGGGVTFSGGEPLVQYRFLAEALAACRARELSTAVDTCGYAPPEALDAVAPHTDLFLYDLKLMDDAAHRRFTGVSNAPILANLRRLAAQRRRTIARFPVIPGYTDSDSNVDALLAFLGGLGTVREVHLLPYHRSAGGKYERLGRPNRTAAVAPPSAERMAELRDRFEAAGFTTKIGG